MIELKNMTVKNIKTKIPKKKVGEIKYFHSINIRHKKYLVTIKLKYIFLPLWFLNCANFEPL